MQKDSYKTPARTYAKGIGDAVADRTINRKIDRMFDHVQFEDIEIPRRDDISLDHEVSEWCKSNGRIAESYFVHEGDDLTLKITLTLTGKVDTETWADVAKRVATGSSMLTPAGKGNSADFEFHKMHHHLRQASLLMSGRHLQHGDETQPTRNMEVFTNCSTSAMTSLSFYLLLNGSGVGRAYDDDMMVVDYANLPIVVPVIDMMHKDSQSGEIVALDFRNAEHLYAGRTMHYFEVPDSREGWAKALEKMEVLAFEAKHRDSVLVLDFSKVRPRGSPIGGMQNRPASGPGPLISAIKMIAQLRDAGMAPWRSTMFADHYAAECVLVGGARRAARMATKTWRDASVVDFIQVKRGGFLWSSNNSVTVDDEFWGHVKAVGFEGCATELDVELRRHAKHVFNLIAEASYKDGTGEPGIISQDKLVQNNEGFDGYLDGKYAESERYKMDEDTLSLTGTLAAVVANKRYTQITNPCGEITLIMLGAYCTIADVVPYHAKDDNDAEDAFKTATRALIRTNLMDCLYSREVKRTNRIGVGITGLHEWIWNRFGFAWKDVVDEEKSKEMWLTLSRFKRAIADECVTYSKALGVVAPHTDTTMKPAGCASLDTTVKTAEGVVTMRELFWEHGIAEVDLQNMEDGTWIEPVVQTFVIDEGNVQREVTKLYLNGVKPVHEIEFEDGTVVKLTGNHKLMTKSGWKRVDELTEADEITHF